MDVGRGIAQHVERWRTGQTPEMHDRLVRCWLRIVTDQWVIVDRFGKERPLVPNEAQKRVFLKMLDQAAAGKPIRIIILKSRKLGTSTLVQIVACDIGAHVHNQKALTLAHEATATREIFGIAVKAASKYSYIDGRLAADCNTLDIAFPGTSSTYRCQTAGAVAVGSGGTPYFLHLSERPKWERNKRETYVSAMDALPDNPLTVCIDESTAKGRDDFWHTWWAAHSGNHPFEAMFIPWYVDEELRAVVPDGFARDEEEKELARRAAQQGIEISNEALQWRRDKVRVIGPLQFKQEYPSTPQEAVQTAEGLILPDVRTCLVDTLPFDYAQVPHELKTGGIDYGYSHTDATVIVSAVRWHHVLYVVGVWRGLQTLAEEQAQGLLPGHRYYDDPSGLGARKELTKAAYLAGVRCSIGPPARKRTVGEDVGSVELNHLASCMARGLIKGTDKALEQFIVEADSFCWNPKTGKPDDSRDTAWGHFDTVYAMKYMVMGEYGLKAPMTVRKPSSPLHVGTRQQMRYV